MRINFLNECRLWFFSDVFDTRYSFHVPCSVDDNLSHVNQHSWDCSSGPPYLSNASNTMRLSFRIHVFAAVQRGVHNNLSNMISIKGKLDLESPSAALCIRLAVTELDFTIFYVIARLTAPVQPTYLSSSSQTPTWFLLSNFSPIILVTVLFPIPEAPVIRIKLESSRLWTQSSICCRRWIRFPCRHFCSFSSSSFIGYGYMDPSVYVIS